MGVAVRLVSPSLVAALALAMSPADAAGATGPPEIPDPGFLRSYAETYRFRLGKPSAIAVTPGGEAVLFLRSPPRSFVRDLYVFDPKTGEERRLLAAGDLLGGAEETLSAAEKARRERQRLAARGIARFDLSHDGRRLLVPLSGSLYVIDRTGGAVTAELEPPGGFALDPRFDPTGQRVACVVDGDLWLLEIESGAARRLTERASETVSHGLAEFVAQEEMDRDHGYWFSPDGRFLAYQRTDTAGMEVFTLADPIDPAKPARTTPYPRPGKKNADVRLGVVPAAGGETVWVDWDRARYPYLAAVTWSAGAPLTVLVQNRTQTEERLLAVDHQRGTTRTLLIERDPAWLELDAQMPRWLADGSAFLWTTERNGAKQLELRGRDGALLRAVTDVGFGYRSLVHLDPAAASALVRASDDPTEVHLWRVSLRAGGPPPVRLTDEPGWHDAVASRDGSVRVVTIAPRDGHWRAEVENRAGQRLGTLKVVTDWPPFAPTTELLTVTIAAETAIHSAVTRPRDFDPQLRYPVIVHVYGGPTSQMVRAERDRYLLAQWIADHGFVVVSFDGRGTPGRDRAWQRAVRGDLIGPALDDQAAALEALAARVPELDLERVGIFGWSFGGYFSALAVMRRGDLFKAAVAGAPVTDWRDYDTHYTERYLGLPQDDPEAYARSSVLTWAERLERPLLIIHGTADDNVYFLHALEMSDALFRAGKHHELLALAGLTHMVPDPLITERLYERIMTFLRRHLGPPAALDRDPTAAGKP